MKRILSKAFDREWKRKKAAAQAKWRRKKQDQLKITTPTSITSSLNPTDLRKQEGQKRRRTNTAKLKSENNKLRETVQILRKEIEILRSSPSTTPLNNSPSRIFFGNVSPNAKQRAALRLKDKKENLPHGSFEQVRKKFGINLSKKSLPVTTSRSSIQTQIEDFLCRDDISKLCPEKKKQINGHQIRYRLNYLNILHQQFESETNIDIDYVTFTRYIPSYIKKPDYQNWGTCLCMTCLNPQMKYEKLQQLKNKYSCIKVIRDTIPIDLCDLTKDDIKVNDLKESLTKLYREDIVVTFCEWQKKKIPNCVAPVSTKVPMSVSMKECVKKFISEIDVGYVFVAFFVFHIFISIFLTAFS